MVRFRAPAGEDVAEPSVRAEVRVSGSNTARSGETGDGKRDHRVQPSHSFRVAVPSGDAVEEDQQECEFVEEEEQYMQEELDEKDERDLEEMQEHSTPPEEAHDVAEYAAAMATDSSDFHQAEVMYRTREPISLPRHLGIDAKRLHMMKASTFSSAFAEQPSTLSRSAGDIESEMGAEETIPVDLGEEDSFGLVQSETDDHRRASFSSEPEVFSAFHPSLDEGSGILGLSFCQPRTHLQLAEDVDVSTLPSELPESLAIASLAGSHSNNVSLARSFRVGWGPRGIFAFSHYMPSCGTAPVLVQQVLEPPFILDSASTSLSSLTASKAQLRTEAAPSSSPYAQLVTKCLSARFEFYRGATGAGAAVEAPVASSFASASSLFAAASASSAPDQSKALDFFDRLCMAYVSSLGASASSSLMSTEEGQRREYHTSVWRLLQALFSPRLGAPISDFAFTSVMGDQWRRSSYQELFARRAAISQWVRSALTSEIQQELKHVAEQKGSHPSATLVRKALTLLSGCRIEEACEQAMKAGDMRLATLIAQAGEDAQQRQDLKEQRIAWFNSGFWDLMDDDHKKIYLLLSGEVGVNAKDSLSHYSWLRCFGLHLWFGSNPNASLAEVVEAFKEAVREKMAASPLPPHYRAPPASALDSAAEGKFPASRLNSSYANLGVDLNEFDAAPLLHAEPTSPRRGQHSYRSSSTVHSCHDLRYALVRMMVCDDYPLHHLLLPDNCTASPLDYQLPWFVFDALRHLGKSFDNAAMLFVSFATQLELMGLWEWAVYVVKESYASHPQIDTEQLIKEIISRNCGWGGREDRAAPAKETFLVDNCHISAVWFEEAKALRAKYERNAERELEHLLKANLFAEAHSLLLDSLAPRWVLQKRHDDLLQKLGKLEEAAVRGWKGRGELYLEYVRILRDCKAAVQAPRMLRERIERLAYELRAVPQAAELKMAHATMYSALMSELSKLSDDPLLESAYSAPALPEDARLHQLHLATVALL